jgi:uncharacterized small protein (DUF1192 family)
MDDEQRAQDSRGHIDKVLRVAAMTTPTPEALAKEVVSFHDAHTCAHSPGCLACMLEERIVNVLIACEQRKANYEEATRRQQAALESFADLNTRFNVQAREIERLRAEHTAGRSFLDALDADSYLPAEFDTWREAHAAAQQETP